MSISNSVLLPGTEQQLKFLINHIDPAAIGKTLIAGASSETIGLKLKNYGIREIDIVVEDYDSLMNSNLVIDGVSGLQVKMMDLTNTDYRGRIFSLIYSQGGTGNIRRNKIMKEFSKIMLPEGILCLGEITLKRKDIPQFVKDIFDKSGILPLLPEDLSEFYSKHFEVIETVDLSDTLKDYYALSKDRLKLSLKEMNDNERQYMKTVIKQIKHEADSYLKHGADKFIGFTAALLRKKAS